MARLPLVAQVHGSTPAAALVNFHGRVHRKFSAGCVAADVKDPRKSYSVPASPPYYKMILKLLDWVKPPCNITLDRETTTADDAKHGAFMRYKMAEHIRLQTYAVLVVVLLPYCTKLVSG